VKLEVDLHQVYQTWCGPISFQQEDGEPDEAFLRQSQTEQWTAPPGETSLTPFTLDRGFGPIPSYDPRA
jgi:hypothetical protein